MNNFILAEELFAKALRSFETYKLYVYNNNSCGNLFSLLESPTTFDESFKVILVPFFVPNFSLLSCELDYLSLKCYIESFYIKAKNKSEYY